MKIISDFVESVDGMIQIMGAQVRVAKKFGNALCIFIIIHLRLRSLTKKWERESREDGME